MQNERATLRAEDQGQRPDAKMNAGAG